MAIHIESFEKVLARGNLISFEIDCIIIHPVKVFNNNGKLKKIITTRQLLKRHDEIGKLESKNRRFLNASARKIQEPHSTQ